MALLEINNKVYNIPNKAMEEIKKVINELNEENEKLKEKINLAENILYDYLYKDGKITEELYLKYKGEEKWNIKQVN